MTAFLPLIAVSLIGLCLAGVGSQIGSALVTSFGLLSVGLVGVAVGVTHLANDSNERRSGANGTEK